MFGSAGRVGRRLRCFDCPSGGVECRGYAQYSAFAPDTQFCSQLFRSSSWLLDLQSFWVQSLPQVPTHSFIFSPLLFLCILLLKERCVRIQTLQHCNKGSQVPACLERTRRGGLNQGHSRDLRNAHGRGVLVAAHLDEDETLSARAQGAPGSHCCLGTHFSK